MQSLLVIGGTVFLGRHIVAAAKSAGLQITTFNRGTHDLEEQKGLEKIFGDRKKEEDLALLKGRHWDAVIDVCGMEASTVAKSALALADAVDAYVFISSISAYDNFRKPNMNEHDAAKLTPLEQEQDYGSNKAWCEKTVEDIYGKRAYNIRPGLIVGAFDPSDRFTYWVRRVAKGGRVLAPGNPEQPVQFIDVRDLAEWILRIVLAQLPGTYNATGPGYVLQIKDFLRQCQETSGSNAEFCWLAEEQLLQEDLKWWTEVPLWIPQKATDYSGFRQIDCVKAQNRGLSYRTLSETIDYTLNWDRLQDQSEPLKAGLDYEKEQRILSRYF